MPAVPNLPTPDFTFDPSAPGACVAGVRPWRAGAYRLEGVPDGARYLVHNYGHGGAGITLSLGCAAQVKGLVAARVATTHDATAAVLGAGVMGLTTAAALADLGLSVIVYTDRAIDKTTSYKAGGQWAVSIVEHQGKDQELAQILRAAHAGFTSLIGKGYGVVERPNYSSTETPGLELVLRLAPGLLPARKNLRRMPFQGHTGRGFEYRTLLIEPPTFLPKLASDLRSRGVEFVDRHFASAADIWAAVPDNVIVNCTGLGAKKLFNDNNLAPIRGQLAMLPAQWNLQYLYGQNGYMFPRSDHVVIGGTIENSYSETPDPAECKALVKHMAGLFGAAPPVAMSTKHIHHPANAALVSPAMPDATV